MKRKPKNTKYLILCDRMKTFYTFIILWLLLLLMFFVSGCRSHIAKQADDFAIEPSGSLVSEHSGSQDVEASPDTLWPDEPVLTAAEVAHEPFGLNALYGAKEVPPIWWERSPRSPQESDEVTIGIAAWSTEGDVWLEWKLNGEQQPSVPCRHTKNHISGNVTKRQYEGNIGSFMQGDLVEYLVRTETESLGPYSFSVTKWEQIDHITERENGVYQVKSASLDTSISVSYPEDGTLRLSVNSDLPDGKPHIGNPVVKLHSNPFCFEIIDESGDVVVQSADIGGLRLLTDGVTVSGIEMNLYAPEQQGFYGFGMRYDSLNQRGKDVDIYCVNWYTDQVGESYTPVPYYFVPDTYGLFLDTTAYSRFSLGSREPDVCSIYAETESADFYVFTGGNAAIADRYTNIAGKPVLPPVWAFGPWISANEWDSQGKVMEQLAETEKHDIPTSVIVLEAWSDEETFYIWNDAEYIPQSGKWLPSLSDFSFKGRWPDPIGMVDAIHDAGMKLLLWQIPVLRHSAYGNAQLSRDIKYAERERYVISNADGTPYRMPRDTWFGNSLLIDFTNSDASQWFLDKRRYLLEEFGIDGFKTDGGEFVWGMGTTSHSGISGIALRNAYPDLYAQAYFDYSREISPDALTFSRAGGSAMQRHPICWIGDQHSTQRAFEDAIRATLSASMSGIPFVAWDIAGFSGDIPSTELYQRSVAQAAFSPIMQIHSETNSAGTPPSRARTPWNMAERKGNDTCLDTYRYYANLRMNLLPYIYSEARHSSLTGEPLMRSMAYAFPSDPTALEYETQYMLGRSLLVAPVADIRATAIEVYLPDGVWYDFFTGREYPGGVHQIECSMDEIPVFAKAGSIIPLNLGESGELGASIGNNLSEYTRLTFYVFSDDEQFEWYDYVRSTDVTVAVDDVSTVFIDGIVHNYEVLFVR